MFSLPAVSSSLHAPWVAINRKIFFFWISHHHKFACMATEGKMHTSFISSLMSSLAGSNSSRMRSQRAANQPHTSMKLYVRCKDTQESDRTIQTYLISSNSSHSLWTHTPPPYEKTTNIAPPKDGHLRHQTSYYLQLLDVMESA